MKLYIFLSVSTVAENCNTETQIEMSRDWQNPQVWPFSDCCSADFGPSWSVNQLHNNQKINELEDFTGDERRDCATLPSSRKAPDPGNHASRSSFLAAALLRAPGGKCIEIGLPGKSILGYYFQENKTSIRPFILGGFHICIYDVPHRPWSQFKSWAWSSIETEFGSLI